MNYWLRLVLPLLLMLFVASTDAEGSDELIQLEEEAFFAAIEQVAPSVVRIETIGGLERVEGVLISRGPTTGLIISSDGYLVSSAFNFVQQPASILVTLPSGERVPAEIVSRDTNCMLVLLKVDAEGPLPVPEAVPRGEMQVGQWAVAVGRTYDQKLPNMSVGILSAVNRIWGKAVQTDAKISPSNYGGPLVDIRGRVLGVLVPLSPDSQKEVAGAQWYDSGIGFAIPLADIQERLPRWKSEDLVPGLLGVSLKSGSAYAGPIEIAACQVTSPAYEAGLRAGDLIARCNDLPVDRPTQLRHILGRKYAGDTVTIVVQRDDETVTAEVELVDELIPFEPPLLGVLPMRVHPEDAPGVSVRHVFDSVSEETLQPGDRILQIGGEPIESVADLRLRIANLSPGDEVTVNLQRDNHEVEANVTLSSLPSTIPESLPAPLPETAKGSLEAGPGRIDLAIPAESNKCFAYVPDRPHPDLPYGVLIRIRPPGDDDDAGLLERWRSLCDARQLILLAPSSGNPQRWNPTEIEFIRKALDSITDRFEVDPLRIAVLGDESAGAMGFVFAFRFPELVHGIIAIDAGIPRVAVPATDPVHPKAFFLLFAEEAPLAERIAGNVERLREMKHNVIAQPLPGKPRPLSEPEREAIARWLDTLDRI